jgi:hypothetical protein
MDRPDDRPSPSCFTFSGSNGRRWAAVANVGPGHGGVADSEGRRPLAALTAYSIGD